MESPPPLCHAPPFAHVNIVARDWRALAAFYEEALGCKGLAPARDLSGRWLDEGAGKLTFCYLFDPEHNVVELRRWHRDDKEPPARP